MKSGSIITATNKSYLSDHFNKFFSTVIKRRKKIELFLETSLKFERRI